MFNATYVFPRHLSDSEMHPPVRSWVSRQGLESARGCTGPLSLPPYGSARALCPPPRHKHRTVPLLPLLCEGHQATGDDVVSVAEQIREGVGHRGRGLVWGPLRPEPRATARKAGGVWSCPWTEPEKGMESKGYAQRVNMQVKSELFRKDSGHPWMGRTAPAGP